MPPYGLDPNFNPLGHDFALDGQVGPHGQHRCRRCGVAASDWDDNGRPSCAMVLELAAEMGHQFATAGGTMTQPGWHSSCLRCGMDIGTWHQAPQERACASLPAPTAPPEQLTDAESLGVLVAGVVVEREQQRDQAREMVVRLEQQLAGAVRHLTACLAVLAEQGTTFATDSRSVSQANEFLEGLRSEQTPETGA